MRKHLLCYVVLLFGLSFVMPGQAQPQPQASAPKGDKPEEDTSPPRRTYNQARLAFEKNDFATAEKGFLAARDRAGEDDELRYSAAFNLGLTHAKKADELGKGQQPKLKEAVDALSQAAAWFRDAVQIRPKDEDARINLEKVLLRMRQLLDQLNQGQNALVARLSRVIQDQRTLRDQVRGLVVKVKQAGASGEPLGTGLSSEFEDQATTERVVFADSGSVLDLGGQERDKIQAKAPEQRTEEEKARLVQLDNLEHYLNRARDTMSDVSRLLSRLQGDRGLSQAEAALSELKRAMEQLQDPVTVLKGLASDETQVLSQTQVLLELQKRTLLTSKPEAKTDAKPQAKTAPPPWLSAITLSEIQRALEPRTRELLARLEAGVGKDQGASGTSEASTKEEDIEHRRVLAAAREAIPRLKEAASAMDKASTTLTSPDPSQQVLLSALRAEAEALAALFAALERFSGVRDLIELVYAEQGQVLELLSPREATLSTAERASLIKKSEEKNRERLSRLKALFAEEAAALAAKLAQAESNDKDKPGTGQAPGQPPGQAPGQPSKEELAQEQQRYKRAEVHRQSAATFVDQVLAGLGKGGQKIQDSAKGAHKEVEELRKLFFTLIEHLKELTRNQIETHDSTSQAQGDKDDTKKRQHLAPLSAAQTKHAALGKALAEALAAQADQAAKQHQGAPGSAPSGKDQGKVLAEAVKEVKDGTSQMEEAAQKLADDQNQAVSPDLDPVLEHQKQAIAHLEKALRLLEPPKQEPKEQKDQQKQQEQNQQKDEEQLSQEQAARQLQAIREREAERQRQKQKRQQGGSEPVEKDW